MTHYITQEISHETDGTLVEHGSRGADTVHRFAAQAASVDQNSVFGSPFSYLSHIQNHYRASRSHFYIFDSHHCLKGDCTYIPLRVSVFRHIAPDGYQYHICFTDECKHTEKNHVCRLPPGSCPHARSYSRADTYVYTSLFTCTRTGRVHLCGTECRAPFSDTSRGGVHICPLTGIALGSIMEHATGAVETGDTLESIEYGDEHMIEDEEVEYIEAGPSWTDRREKQKLLTGPGFKDMKTRGSMTPEEKIKLRQYRLKRANEELEKHVYTATTTLENAMRPLKVIEDTSHSRAWPGTLEMMCQVYAACPPLVHPSWITGGKPPVPPAGGKPPAPPSPEHFPNIPAFKRTGGVGGVGGLPPTLPLTVVDIYERVEHLVEYTFDESIASILHMMRTGVVLDNPVVVAIRQHPGMEWYAKRKLVPVVFVIQKALVEALKQTYMNKNLGASV